MGESVPDDSSTDPRRLLELLDLTVTLSTVLDPVPGKRSTVVGPLNKIKDTYSRLRFVWPVGPRAKLLEEAGYVTFLEKLHKHNSELLQTVAKQAGRLSQALAKPASKKTTLRDVNKDLAKLWQMLEASFRLAADGSDDTPVDQLVAACTALEGKAALLLHPPDVWAFWATDFHGSPTGMAVLEHLVSAITSRWNPFPKALSVLEGYGGTLPEAKASVIRTTLFLRPDLTKPSPATPTAKG